MRSDRALLLLCLVAALAVAASCAREKGESQVGGNAVAWMTSLDAAMSAAREKDLPVMIDFFTDWCGWCKRLDADTYVDGQVVTAARGFVSVKVDADADRMAASRYGVTGFPTILFVDPSGNEIHRVVGYRPPQAFLVEMNKALEAFKGRS